jgi:NAD(P)-dependent dehydrogenase (short-subunit alcohol dehydrogenase family)
MKTVLVTGSNRGIGLELAKQYADDGARVLACCRSPQSADALQKKAAASDRRVTIHPLDVTHPEDITALKREIGDMPIDTLINNAGISGGKEWEVDYDEWEAAFRVNSIGPYRMSTAFRANLAASNEKKLATISSQMGSIANNTGGRTAYRSSKAAVNMVMKGLASEFQSDGIAVIIFHPGWVRTDMGGPQAPVSPEESARGLRHIIENFSIKSTGKFIDYQGHELPW